ncbi:MAG TPA: ATPase domain-containing protein [Ktedonobacterales bacterium]|nr:ATPase domain-containing protein [Ktedonobacterales bacterium]
MGATDNSGDPRGGSPAAPEPRDLTGVPHLDRILGGGLPRGSLVLVLGVPGSGKTTLAGQIAFTAARAGKRVLILTAFSESTSKLIAHLRAFSYFEPSLIGGVVQFLSLQSSLAEGLETAADAILSEARRVKAAVVVLDGFRGLDSLTGSARAARQFLFTVGTTLSALGATLLITAETDPRDPTFFPEATTADVILGMQYQLFGVRQHRGIEVIKARTSAPLPGLHAMTLSADGVSVYPQLEERIAADVLGSEAQTQGAAPGGAQSESALDPGPARAAFGLPELDTMLAGGIPRATCTLLVGSLGTGKTLMSLYFALAGVRNGEAVAYLGFRESQRQLRLAASAFEIGPALEKALRPGGSLTFLEVPPIKVNADILADRLLHLLDHTGARRLVIDSVAELERAILRSPDPQRLEDYLAALLIALRERGVTALMLKETDKAIAATLDFSADPLSVLAENVILLQQVPYAGELHRILAVLKLRFSGHDTTLREFRITSPAGLEVLEPGMSEHDVLAGITERQQQHAGHLQSGEEPRHSRNRPAQPKPSQPPLRPGSTDDAG